VTQQKPDAKGEKGVKSQCVISSGVQMIPVIVCLVVSVTGEPTTPFRANTVWRDCKWRSKVEGRIFYSQVVERKEPSEKWDPSTDPGCQRCVASRLALANWLAVVPANDQVGIQGKCFQTEHFR
jgi:hypothetical protein